jgi:hypothetical protein
MTVDAHTAHHLWNHCFKSELMHRRTTILVSHHIQLCGPDSKLILALDGGRVRFSGPWLKFQGSNVMNSILVSNPAQKEAPETEKNVEEVTTSVLAESVSQYEATNVNGKPPATKKVAQETRKLIKEEERFEGRISTDVWLLYIRANGSFCFWLVLWVVLLLSSLSPVWENGWLKCVHFSFVRGNPADHVPPRIWSASGAPPEKAVFFLSIYAGASTFATPFVYKSLIIRI